MPEPPNLGVGASPFWKRPIPDLSRMLRSAERSERKRDFDALVVNQGGLMAEMRRGGKPHWRAMGLEGPEQRGGRAKGLH